MKTSIPKVKLERNIEALAYMFEEICKHKNAGIMQDDIDCFPELALQTAVMAGWIPFVDRPEDGTDANGDRLVEVGSGFGIWIEKSERDEFREWAKRAITSEDCNWEIVSLWDDVRNLKEMGRWDGPTDPDDDYLLQNKDRIRALSSERALTEQVRPSNPRGDPERPAPTRRSAAEIIKAWKDKTGCTIEQLADQAGVMPLTIYRIQKGKFPYSQRRDALKLVAQVVGCERHELRPNPTSLQ